jgi:UDP-2,3-diacylglucosamine hydrolase
MIHAASPHASPFPVLGVVAGGGSLPRQLVECCKAQGRPCFVVVLDGFAKAPDFHDVPHASVRLGAVGDALAHLRRAGATQLVLAGRVKRPSLPALRPDMTGAKLLARLGASFFAGDDALLKSVIGFLEEEGFAVVGADQVMASLLAPLGTLGRHAPSPEDELDIAQGIKVALALGAADVGQAAMVERGCVLGVEGAEGTDELIARCAKLKRAPKAGVLVKMKKPGQDARADLPSVGVNTVEALAAAGFAGLAVEAGGSLVLEQDALVARADALGLFVVGVPHG